MHSFTAQLEIDASPTEKRSTDLLDALAGYSPTVGRSDHGRLEATVTLDARDIWHAIGLVRELISVHVPEPVRVEVLPTDVFDQRSETDSEAQQYVSVADAAEELNVSRQRVLQMINEGKLIATRLGRTWAVLPGSLAQRKHDA